MKCSLAVVATLAAARALAQAEQLHQYLVLAGPGPDADRAKEMLAELIQWRAPWINAIGLVPSSFWPSAR